MSTTPNMQLVVPEVLVTTGPQYATQINTALDVVDAHDHSPGKGVRITPSGLNINTDLPFGNNAATGVKAVALQAQTSVLTTGAVYNKGGNLFYRDGSSNEIQLTSGGALNVSSVGAITGLTSPASAAFVSLNSSFVFQNDASTYAKLEIGDVLVYSRAGSVGTVQAVTLVADAATSAYSLRLPTGAPIDNQIMRMKSATASQFVDLLGTTNQVVVTQNTSDITLSLPQSIHTGATPTFASLTLTGGIGLAGALTGGTTGSFSGQVNVGSLVSGGAISGTAISGSSGSFTGALSAGGNVSLTGPSLSTLSAPNYVASFLGISTDTITPLTGTSILMGAIEVLQPAGVKTDALAPYSGVMTISDARYSGLSGSTSLLATQLGYTTRYIATSNVNFTSSLSYNNNIMSLTLPNGHWVVEGQCIVFIQASGGNSTTQLQYVEAGISTNSGAFDDDSYNGTTFLPNSSYIVNNPICTKTFSRTIASTGTTVVYFRVKYEKATTNSQGYISGASFINIRRVA